MGQVTIYIDDETEQKARAAASAEGVSLSRWVAARIARRSRSEWPAAVRSLAGAWPDLPEKRAGKRTSKDAARARL